MRQYVTHNNKRVIVPHVGDKPLEPGYREQSRDHIENLVTRKIEQAVLFSGCILAIYAIAVATTAITLMGAFLAPLTLIAFIIFIQAYKIRRLFGGRSHRYSLGSWHEAVGTQSANILRSKTTAATITCDSNPDLAPYFNQLLLALLKTMIKGQSHSPFVQQWQRIANSEPMPEAIKHHDEQAKLAYIEQAKLERAIEELVKNADQITANREREKVVEQAEKALTEDSVLNQAEQSRQMVKTLMETQNELQNITTVQAAN